MAALVVSACSPDTKLEDLQTSATGTLSAIPAVASSIVGNALQPPKGSATEVYTRIARGLLTCWMGPHGEIKQTHQFRAEARPRSEGGDATIAIYEKSTSPDSKLGRKVFTVAITPVASNATVTPDNIALPQDLSDRITADVYRWAAAEEGCAPEPIKEGWGTAEKASSPAGKK